ncbi:hypothetical protein BDW69DRAFT_189415 [Aspergillus filifer]
MSTLVQCPAEIIDIILSFLNLSDICAFRLTSRHLAYKVCSAPSLGFHLQQRHVDITEHSLRALANATAKPYRLGCFIQDLVLVGVVNNTKLLARETRNQATDAKAQQDLAVLTKRQKGYETMRASGYDVRLLSQIFRNLIARGRYRSLRSLSLAVVVYREDAQKRLAPIEGGGWMPIWQAATDTFHTALAALAKSGILVQKLDIYNSLKRCSLACNEPSAVDFESNALATSLASLETLAVSFSDRVINLYVEDFGQTGDSADSWDEDGETRELEDMEAEACHESTFTGIAGLVQHFQGLESLELHYYQLDKKGEEEVSRHPERFLQYIVMTASLPPLKRVVLRGFRVRSVDLLTFLSRLKRTLREVALQNLILLADAKYRPILDYCTSEGAGLDRLYLDNLLEPEISDPAGNLDRDKLVYFTGEPNQRPKFLWRQDLPRHGSNTVDRIGAAQIRRPIPYFSMFFLYRYTPCRAAFYPNIRPSGSPWLDGRPEYGPP